MKHIGYSILFMGILTVSCKAKIQENPPDLFAEKARKDEALIKMNSYIARRNQLLISQFVKRTGLGLKETGSGLWYGIYSKGNGKAVKEGNRVEISYNLKLLDGTPIDSISMDKPKTFIVGKGGVESGIEAGILLLNEGDHALFILPPHLAFGNFGDQGKIPPGAILFYDLYLVGVKP